MSKRPIAAILSGGFFCFLIGLDQVSKWWARQQGWSVINAGISFGWLNGEITWLPMLLLVLTVIGIASLMLRKLYAQLNLAIILILAGATANLIDRIVWGGVVDWLSVPESSLKNNLADWAIFMGVLILVINQICRFKPSGRIKI